MTKGSLTSELEIIDFWKQNSVYEKLKKKNKGGKKFNHVDGPPYPTGEVHLGHLRNWTVKDSVLRFRALQGYEVYARDGYDVHGLPVENKVQAKLGLKTVDDLKKFGEENFVLECKKYVNDIINDMEGVRNRFGLWMDRDSYRTSHPDYLSMAWRFFKEADKKGLLYKDYKTVAWCPNDETTLSDYEIKDTYKEIVDPSIYVKFPIKKEFKTTKYDESILIWTTTPWTLQSNMAVAMHPEFDYSKILIEINGKEEVLLFATSLVENVLETLSKQNKVKFVKVLETKKGAEYEGVKYDHIYVDETPSQKKFASDKSHKHVHSVVMADFVTLGEGEDIFDKLEKKGYKHSNVAEEKVELKNDKKAKSEGTGIVHIAPGHGFDDYEVGKKYNIPIFCPVGVDGKFTEGKYEGMYFKDVDAVAIKYLREKGYLLSDVPKKHRYPCCWRCKTPIVYRAADQWWIRRGNYTDDIIKENSNVRWYPKSAKVSFNNLMKNAGDWAISRQRYWGIPLPIFESEDGDYLVMGSKEELEEKMGMKFDDIHRDDLKNLVIEENGKEYYPVPFIADVWFDSGCASFASHYGEGLSFEQIIKEYYPIKWITEGEDQIRGWFSSLFNVGYVVTEKAPYNEVLFQGFVMDETGKQKMSKSLANGFTGNEAIDMWGADKTRYYLTVKSLSETKLNFDKEEMVMVDGFFNTLENLISYMDGYLNEHDVRFPSLNFLNLDVEDKWIMYRLNRTIETFVHNFESYKMTLSYRALEEFIVRDLSKTYLKLVKDRTDDRDENLLIIFSEILKKVLVMLAPVVPFATENLYQKIGVANKKESIFFENMPEADKLLIRKVEELKIDENFEIVQDIIAATLNAREKAKIGIRWPLPQIDIISHRDISCEFKIFENMIKKLVNVSKINYDMGDVDVNYIIKPNFATLKQDFDDMKSAISVINKNKYYISEDLKLGQSSGTYDDLTIDYEKHIIKEIELKGDFASSDFSSGSVILHTHQDEILLEEGYLRELVRKVQSLRKDMGLEKRDEISLSFDGSDEYYKEIVDNWSSYICKKVGAKEIRDKSLENREEFEIKGKRLAISVAR